jgi:hypothetical protein
MKHEELGHCIVQYEKAFKPDNFIELLENECRRDWGYLNWYQTKTGIEGNQVVTQHRTSLGCEMSPLMLDKSQIAIDRIKPLAEMWMTIREKLEPVIWHYRNMYSVHLEQDEGFRVLKYGRGAEYKGHVDHHPNNKRVLSIIGFLNEDFSGGEIEFPLLNLTVKPKAGSVLLFPSNFPYFHSVNPTGTNDETVRYSFVSWFS